MPTRSQRPIVARLLALDPLPVADKTYASLDRALEDMGKKITPAQLAAALYAHDVDVSRETLYRWRREIGD